jgi:hypothetical protein
MASVEPVKVRKAKAKLTQDHVNQLMCGEKLVISLKDGQTQLQLELTADEDFKTALDRQIDAAMKALDDTVENLERVVTNQETQGLFTSLKTSFNKIFRGK